jgi:GTP-sensing pleiotropic transcriptional regulator CodY
LNSISTILKSIKNDLQNHDQLVSMKSKVVDTLPNKEVFYIVNNLNPLLPITVKQTMSYDQQKNMLDSRFAATSHLLSGTEIRNWNKLIKWRTIKLIFFSN